MSTRYEWTTANYTSADYLDPGNRADGQPVEDHDEEGVTAQGAIVLGYDEAFVIEGTPRELRDLIQRMLDCLPTE